MKIIYCLAGMFIFSVVTGLQGKAIGQSFTRSITSPILFKGNDSVAYRDPAVLFNKGVFYLFFTVVKTQEDARIYSYTAVSRSKDLARWTPPEMITPKYQDLNFSSPGNIVRFKNEWILCLQTYPRPGYKMGQKIMYGNSNARLYIMRSKDLRKWSDPELLKVQGDISFEQMGRMIDPYLLEDKDYPGKWWCFYKYKGVSMSYTYDMKHWVYAGNIPDGGENTCVLVEKKQYLMFHSPHNGIGLKRSHDLVHWTDDTGLITLGQQNWPWAKGRITAATVINLKRYKPVGKYLMFFHGSGPKTELEGDFDKNASIGFAWSDDLMNWTWPGKM
jgi:hypothetical protein